MRRSVAFALVSCGLVVYALGAVMASNTPPKPFHQVVPKYDVTVPEACEGRIQALVATTNTDVNMPVRQWLRLKQEVERCGGSAVEVK